MPLLPSGKVDRRALKSGVLALDIPGIPRVQIPLVDCNNCQRTNSVCKTGSHDMWPSDWRSCICSQSETGKKKMACSLGSDSEIECAVMSTHQVFTTPQSPRAVSPIYITLNCWAGLLGCWAVGQSRICNPCFVSFVKLRAPATTLGGREDRD